MPAEPSSPPAQRLLYLRCANSVPPNIAPPGYCAETLSIYIAPIDSVFVSVPRQVPDSEPTTNKRRRGRVRRLWSGFVSRVRNGGKRKSPGGQGSGGGSQGGAII